MTPPEEDREPFEWWYRLPGSARTGILVGLGVPLWFLWFVGGVAVANGLHNLWWPLGYVCLAVDFGVAVGVPVWLACRGLDQ